MSINIVQAAETFQHYILFALEQSGAKISVEMRMELSEAVEAFKALPDKRTEAPK